MGYFPNCLRLRPVKDALPPRFEAAEVLNLRIRFQLIHAIVLPYRQQASSYMKLNSS